LQCFCNLCVPALLLSTSQTPLRLL
jgi:hypothetical protein